MNILIVESPAKGKTIEKYLGSDYKVVASFGHVRDLPEKELGVDVSHDFKPHYIIPYKSRKVVSNLKKAVAGAKEIYMATDYDREGEAIAWHIVEALKLKDPKRITFHEITKDAIREAVTKPRKIDMYLVDAQQARRVLDRLVGYKLSPFLWRKIYAGLSAGRVQSLAVRLIVEREREIEKFKPEEYWTILAELEKNKQKFKAVLIEKDNKKIDKLEIKTERDAKNIIEKLEKSEYTVKNVEEKQENRWPSPPFNTSSMQQEASKRLSFTAKKTMKLAQDLYEHGHITYMRTDSFNLSVLAQNTARKFIKEKIGIKYLPDMPRVYKTKTKAAQEAHEAIRPTHLDHEVNDIGNPAFSEDHLKLYDLIWRRTIASQMKEALLDTIAVDIQAGNFVFRANGVKINFEGFMRIWQSKVEEKTLPDLKKEDLVNLIELLKEQHFTEPPARFTEASLIKTLEENGIGRPSTYAPIISTIQDRKYVTMEQRHFKPLEIGFIVTDLLVTHFPDIVDMHFTANMEQELDDIAENKKEWEKVIKNFYEPFNKNLENKYDEVKKKELVEEKTDKNCPKCTKPLVIKLGKFGKFLACTGFPECKHTEQIITSTGLKCPECKNGDVIERRTKKGKRFWGCSRYPKCKWGSWDDPTAAKRQKV